MITLTINIRKEIIILLLIFFLCNLLNICSIIVYKTLWKEIYSQLGTVCILSIAVYFFQAFIRSCIYLIMFWKKKHTPVR